MATKQEVKNLIDTTAKTVESSASFLGLDSGVEDAVRLDFAMFMMYLSASDGEIEWEEASMISDLCGFNVTPQSLSTFIREKNIYSTEYENQPPLILQILVKADNRLCEMNVDIDVDIMTIIIDTYKAVASMIMNADGDIEENEKVDCNIYIKMLEKYINENSQRRKSSVSGFTKNLGSVSAPTKSGVSAPIKKG